MPELSSRYLTPPKGCVSRAPLLLELMRPRHQPIFLADLARRSGLRFSTVHRIFHGRRSFVDVYVADRLAIAFGVHPIVLWPDEWLEVEDVTRRAAG